MTFKDINKLLQPIKRKIFLTIGRGVIDAINNSEKTQKLQTTALSGEPITDMERLQNYGFESYPVPANCEHLFVCVNGNRDQGVSIVVSDRENRPSGMEEGETQMYCIFGQKLYFKKDGTFYLEDGNGNYIKSTSDLIDINGNHTVNK